MGYWLSLLGHGLHPVLLLQDRYNLQGKGGTVLGYPIRLQAAAQPLFFSVV